MNKPGQAAVANNQPVGSAGQPNPFAALASAKGKGKKKPSDTKSAAIERRMQKLKGKAAKK
jgi:hypothetical protein